MAFALSMRPSTLRLLSSGRQYGVRQSRSVVAARPYCQAGERIGKMELKKEIAEKANISEAQAATVLDTTLSLIVEHVAAGRAVVITGFGTFEKRHRAARTGRNPQTGEPLKIEEKDVPGFTAGSSFKKCVSEGSAANWKAPADGVKAPKATTKAAAKK